LVSQRHRARVEEYVRLGQGEGARLATGGSRSASPPLGYYLEPTLLIDAGPGMRVTREEIFGPVLVALPYDTKEAGLAMANDSDYGLAGMVYSSDPERALAVGAQIQAGTVGVNSLVLNTAAPFGGWKDSGLGSELGPEAVGGYTRLQSTTGLLT